MSLLKLQFMTYLLSFSHVPRHAHVTAHVKQPSLSIHNVRIEKYIKQCNADSEVVWGTTQDLCTKATKDFRLNNAYCNITRLHPKTKHSCGHILVNQRHKTFRQILQYLYFQPLKMHTKLQFNSKESVARWGLAAMYPEFFVGYQIQQGV